MQYLDAIPKLKEWSLFISKANNSIAQSSKSLPQLLMPKKMKLKFLWRPTRSSRTNTLKRCPFHHRGLESKSRKSRDTWSNRPVSPWSTKWSTEKGNIVLPRECTGRSNTLFQQHERRLYTWTSPDGQYRNQTDYFFAAEDREALYTGSWLWFRSWTPYCQI